MQDKAEKILCIRLSAIGDIVLTTPVLRCLKQQLPHAEVHFLVKPAFAAAIQHNPYIDRLHYFTSIAESLPSLKAENYTQIIDLQHNAKTIRLRWALGKPAKAFYKRNIEKWIFTNFKTNLLPPNEHIVDRYLNTVAHLGVSNDYKGLDYFIAPDEEVNIAEYFTGILPYRYIAIAVGAAHPTKQIPLEKLIAICQKLTLPAVLLGGKNDRDTGHALVDALPTHALFNACGNLSLGGSASVIRQAAAVLTPDTGLMHIAAAFGKPIVSVWGNTVPELGMYPYLPPNAPPYIALQIDRTILRCRPCSKIGYPACPHRHFKCMMQLDAEVIAHALQRQAEIGSTHYH